MLLKSAITTNQVLLLLGAILLDVLVSDLYVRYKVNTDCNSEKRKALWDICAKSACCTPCIRISTQEINSETQRLVQNVILKLEKINIVFVKPVMVKHP